MDGDTAQKQEEQHEQSREMREPLAHLRDCNHSSCGWKVRSEIWRESGNMFSQLCRITMYTFLRGGKPSQVSRIKKHKQISRLY